MSDSSDHLAERFQACTGASFEDFMLLESPMGCRVIRN